MTMPAAQADLIAQASEFWKNADRRLERTPKPDIAIRQLPVFAWGIPGLPLTLIQPHYRLVLPNNYRILGWAITADQPCSVVINVEWSPFLPVSNFVDATGGASPTLALQQNVLTLSIPTWTHRNTALFDMLHVYLAAVDGIAQEIMFHLFARVMAKPQGINTVVDSLGNPVVDSSGNIAVARR